MAITGHIQMVQSTRRKVLQLQTAINPGNSGGPVLDDQGKLLGLIAMSEAGQNLDYAVAADVIQSFILSSASVRTRGGAVEGVLKTQCTFLQSSWGTAGQCSGAVSQTC